MHSDEVVLPPYRFSVTSGGSGTPIVLLHGLGGSSEWFRRNLDVIAESHEVHAVDLVGFGRNRFFLRRSRLPLSFEEMPSLLARWIEASIQQPVHLAGNSMGGQIAIHLAAQRPDLVRSLTLVDSTGIPFEIQPRRHLEALVMPRGMLSLALVVVRDLFRAGPGSFAIALARLLRDDARSLMQRLRMPVRLIWGENDPLVPLAYARRMQDILPAARLVVIPRAGHVPMWENPAAFNGALLEFVEEVDAAARPEVEPGFFSWGIGGWSDGIAHRQAGSGRDIVLVHCLGMSSRYFAPLARALFDRGASPVAPDLPGFGESANRVAMTPARHAESLIRWADSLGISDAIWVGHSTGCAVIAAVARLRPALVRRLVCIGPLWSKTRHPHSRFALRLVLDAFREKGKLLRLAIASYWRAGARRWLLTWLGQIADGVRGEPPHEALMMAGARDPLVDRSAVHVVEVPGGHACFFTSPRETAAMIRPDHRDADDRRE